MSQKYSIAKLKRMVKGSFEKDPSKIYLHPERDWLILLGLFFLFTTGLSLYSYHIFMTVSEGEAVLVDDTYDSVQVQHDRFERELNSTLEYYQEKEIEYNKLVNDPPTVFVDPATTFFFENVAPPDVEIEN